MERNVRGKSTKDDDGKRRRVGCLGARSGAECATGGERGQRYRARREQARARILDSNNTSTRSEFLDADDAEDVSVQNSRAEENERRRRQQELDQNEQTLLKLFNDAQRNEATPRATAEQAHRRPVKSFIFQNKPRRITSIPSIRRL